MNTSTSKKILIIEDDPLSGEFLRLFLINEGHEAVRAESCAAAAEVLRTREINVVLTDIDLPDGSPESILGPYKAEGKIRFWGISGYAEEELPAHLSSGFFDGYLQKPVDLSRLSEVL